MFSVLRDLTRSGQMSPHFLCAPPSPRTRPTIRKIAAPTHGHAHGRGAVARSCTTPATSLTKRPQSLIPNHALSSAHNRDRCWHHVTCAHATCALRHLRPTMRTQHVADRCHARRGRNTRCTPTSGPAALILKRNTPACHQPLPRPAGSPAPAPACTCPRPATGSIGVFSRGPVRRREASWACPAQEAR